MGVNTYIASVFFQNWDPRFSVLFLFLRLAKNVTLGKLVNPNLSFLNVKNVNKKSINIQNVDMRITIIL